MLQTQHFASFFLKFKSSLLAKKVFFLLNASFAMAILDLISRVNLASAVLLPRQLPCYSKLSQAKCYMRNFTSATATPHTSRVLARFHLVRFSLRIMGQSELIHPSVRPSSRTSHPLPPTCRTSNQHYTVFSCTARDKTCLGRMIKCRRSRSLF